MDLKTKKHNIKFDPAIQFYLGKLSFPVHRLTYIVKRNMLSKDAHIIDMMYSKGAVLSNEGIHIYVNNNC